MMADTHAKVHVLVPTLGQTVIHAFRRIVILTLRRIVILALRRITILALRRFVILALRRILIHITMYARRRILLR